MRLFILAVIVAVLCLTSVAAVAQENSGQWNCFQKIHEKALTTAVALTPTQLRYALIPFYDSMIDELYQTDYRPEAYQDKKMFDNLYEAAVFEAHKRDDLKNAYFARLMTDLTRYIVQKYYPGRLGGFCREWTYLRYAPVFYGGYDGGDKKPDFRRYAPVIYGGYDKKPLYSKFNNVFSSDNQTDSPDRYTGDMLWYYNKTVNEIVNLWITVWKDADRNPESVIETYTLVKPEDVTPFNYKEPVIYEKRDDLGLFVYEQKNKPETIPWSGYRAVYEMRDDEGMLVMWEKSQLEKPEDYTEIYEIRNSAGFLVYRERYKLIKPLRVFSSLKNAAGYAFNALEDKRYYEAAAILGTLLDRKSKDPDLYYGLGLAMFHINDYINSLINFTKADGHSESLYYVGLINEYLARRATSFDNKISLLADSARAYERYGSQNNSAEAIEKSKSVTINALRQYEKEIPAVISKITDMQSNKKLANAGLYIEMAERLNDQYNSLSGGFNDKYPGAFAKKDYNQTIDIIEHDYNDSLQKELEIEPQPAANDSGGDTSAAPDNSVVPSSAGQTGQSQTSTAVDKTTMPEMIQRSDKP
ncbi:MAG: hypothetical protein L7F77_01185 [Candidatus Magnetominusculus sp. LBB02]|nr:hypothetical protein [Candidatus Magnetominusculus sp. LBB02]